MADEGAWVEGGVAVGVGVEAAREIRGDIEREREGGGGGEDW
jgi:hypothetical protein